MSKFQLASRLDWGQLLGFHDIEGERGDNGSTQKAGSKVGNKVGNKPGVKTGNKVGAKG